MTIAEERLLPAAEPALDRDLAFGRLIDARLDASYRLATLLLGDRQDAEDATHDAVVRAWRSFGSLRSGQSFDAWFQRILVNTCRDRMRRQRRITVTRLTVDPAASDGHAAAAERAALEGALASLSPDHRTVVVLRYFEDLSVEDIAQRLGTRTGTVKSRLHHAIRYLRAAYDAAARTGPEETR